MIKVDKQLPVVTALDPQARRPVQGEQAVQRQRKQMPAEPAVQPRGKSTSFNLQLNQQLTSMQAADSYLGELAGRLGQLKLSLSRELSNAQAGEREGLKRELEQVRQLLAERGQRSGEALDASFKLRLTEPVRSRFSLQGLESMATIQQAGKETLLFSAGRKLAEPLAVVLDEGLSAVSYTHLDVYKRQASAHRLALQWWAEAHPTHGNGSPPDPPYGVTGT